MIRQSEDIQYNSLHTKPFIAYLRDPYLWVIVLGQIALNIGFMARRTLWLDEAYSALMARRSIPDIHSALRFDAGPPLYYDLLHVWRMMVGESELALRSLSLLFSVCAVIVIYYCAARFWNRHAALLSACLFAFTPLTTAYVHEVRNYTLLAALSVVLVLFLMEHLAQPRRCSAVLCGVFGLAVVYTHNLGWFLMPGVLLCSWLYTKKGKDLIGLLVCGAAALVLYAPWIPTLLAQMRNSERSIAWAANFWSPWSLVHTFSAYIPGGMTPSYLDLPSFPHWLQAINALMWITIFTLACIAAYRKRDRKVALVLIILVSGLFGPYIYSLIKTPIYLAGRTDYGLLPFWCLITGYGISRLPWRRAQFCLAIVFLLQAGCINYELLMRDDPLSERDIIVYLQRNTQPGDIILCTGLTRPPLEYALDKQGLTFESYPRDMTKHLAHLNEAWYMENCDLNKEAESVLTDICHNLPDGASIWVAASRRPVNRALLTLIKQERMVNLVKRISTPSMGLRKLNEPVFLVKLGGLIKG